jgi:hypothetical protein
MEVTAVASNISPRQGVPDATRIHYEYKAMDAYRRPNARVNSYPIYLPKCINEEKAHGRKSAVGKPEDSRQNSSSRVISGIPPSQPHSRRRISGEPRLVSVKESYKDAGAGDAPQRGSSALKRLQQGDFKWNSGSGALADRPPLQPFICHKISEASCASTKEYHNDPIMEKPRPESPIRRLQQSDDSIDDSRWSSGYPSSFDISPFQALAGSSIRSLQYYDDSSRSSGHRTT